MRREPPADVRRVSRRRRTSAARLTGVGVVNVVLALVASLVAAPARAAHPASGEQLAALAEVTGFETPCITATVSSRNEHWARVDPQPQRDGCPQGNGFFLVYMTGAEDLEVVAEGSDRFVCRSADVPLAVGRELGVCRASRAYVLCWPGGRSFERVARARPRRCMTLGPHQSFAEAANLVGLSWRSWGAKVARGQGFERGWHLPYEHVPVRVRAYRRREADCGDYVYTRLKLSSRYGALTVRFPATCGDY